jgi:hypothetical protein
MDVEEISTLRHMKNIQGYAIKYFNRKEKLLIAKHIASSQMNINKSSCKQKEKVKIFNLLLNNKRSNLVEKICLSKLKEEKEGCLSGKCNLKCSDKL